MLLSNSRTHIMTKKNQLSEATIEATIRSSRNQSEQIRAIIIGQSIEIRTVIFQMTTDNAKC